MSRGKLFSECEICPLLTCSSGNSPAFHSLLQPRPLLPCNVTYSAWKQTGSWSLSYFLNANDPLASWLTSLSTAWLHCRTDPLRKPSVTQSCHRSCAGIEMRGVQRELASLAIWTCVFKMGFDTSTRASFILLRRATHSLVITPEYFILFLFYVVPSFPLFSFIILLMLEHVLTLPPTHTHKLSRVWGSRNGLNREINTPTRESSHCAIDSKRLEREPGKGS